MERRLDLLRRTARETPVLASLRDRRHRERVGLTAAPGNGAGATAADASHTAFGAHEFVERGPLNGGDDLGGEVGREGIELRAEGLSPPGSESPSISGITGTQGPTRWREDGSSPFLAATGGARGARFGSASEWILSGQGDDSVQGRAVRNPFSRTKCSARSVSRSAMTWALSASGKTLVQSLNARLVVMQVDRRKS